MLVFNDLQQLTSRLSDTPSDTFRPYLTRRGCGLLMAVAWPNRKRD